MGHNPMIPSTKFSYSNLNNIVTIIIIHKIEQKLTSSSKIIMIIIWSKIMTNLRIVVLILKITNNLILIVWITQLVITIISIILVFKKITLIRKFWTERIKMIILIAILIRWILFNQLTEMKVLMLIRRWLKKARSLRILLIK